MEDKVNVVLGKGKAKVGVILSRGGRLSGRGLGQGRKTILGVVLGRGGRKFRSCFVLGWKTIWAWSWTGMEKSRRGPAQGWMSMWAWSWAAMEDKEGVVLYRGWEEKRVWS